MRTEVYDTFGNTVVLCSCAMCIHETLVLAVRYYREDVLRVKVRFIGVSPPDLKNYCTGANEDNRTGRKSRATVRFPGVASAVIM